jgi:hypothetical protein
MEDYFAPMTSAFSSISNLDVCKGVTFFPFDGLREKLGECFREEVRVEMRNVQRAWHLWALPDRLHPPAADCVPLMVNVIRERGKERDVESLVRHNFKIRQSSSVRPSQEARPQISELTQRSAQRRKLELVR